MARPFRDLDRETLIPPVPPVPVPASPAALAELVALVVSPANSAAAAVGILVAGFVRTCAAADAFVPIAVSRATCGVLGAALPAAAAPTGSTVPVPAAPPAVAVSLVVTAPTPPASLTDVGTALGFLATWISRKATTLDEDVVLGQPEIRPSQRGQRYPGGRQLLESRAPVLKSPEHARPVVEPAVVHGLSLLTLL